MHITIDATGSDVSAWAQALRLTARDEEIHVFQSATLGRVFGSAGLDFALGHTDVFHASPLTPCAPRRAKLTASIEDLSCWLMPDLHTPAEIKTAELFAEKILAKADGLIAVSEAARRDAMPILGLPPEKITVIYPGVDDAFFDAPPALRERPYVLCIGSPEPRGNFTTLLSAWNGLPPEISGAYDLVTLDSLDGLTSSDLPGLVAGATLFAHLPFHTYFALPVAQAMAAQVPVVISDTSGLPEVGRDAGIMVNPHEVSGIVDALARLLGSESERAKFARYGRARAEKYRWEKCAADSLAFFHRVVGHG